ncbi:MAG TPA: FecR domain-containing protein [Opitutaceae bacterium]|nr:FecR domain-containing protein [Opitutaceae bacterium]
MNEGESQDQAIDLAAAEWVVRCDRGLSATEERAFRAWLAADPRHRSWFERHGASWGAFEALRREAASPTVRRRRVAIYWLAPLALAAAAGVAVFLDLRGFRPGAPPPPERREIVDTAEGQTQVLSDGSVVDLRPGAAITIAFGPAERGIRLRHGEAQFHVAKNPRWPFIVHASGVAVRAVGTAFDVRVDPTAVEVLVTEGHVQVNHGGGGSASPPCHLLAGERTVVSLQPSAPAPRVVRATSAELSRTLGWQARWLEFNSAPLPQVVAQFNRYNRVQMRIVDPALNAVPIVASFRAGNVDGFVRLLQLTSGIRASREGDVITLSAPTRPAR